MKEWNKYFDHVYVLTLKHADARQERFSKRFNGLQYKFFVGRDPKEISEYEYDQKTARLKNRRYEPLGPEQISCALNHRLIYEDMLKQDYKTALILEDDAVLISENLVYLEQIMGRLPREWGLLYFDYSQGLPPKNLIQGFMQSHFWLNLTRNHGPFTRKMADNLLPKHYSENLMKAGRHMCAAAYAIRPETALKLIALQSPVVFSADWLLAYAAGDELVKAFVSVPRLFKQEGLDSYIGRWVA